MLPATQYSHIPLFHPSRRNRYVWTQDTSVHDFRAQGGHRLHLVLPGHPGGLVAFVGGNFIAGVWYFLIGMFIRGAAQMSYRQVLIRRALGGAPVSQFMQGQVVTVPPSITIRELVDDYFYRYHYKMFPVSGNSRLEGCITSKQIKDIPREQWDRRTVQDILAPCSLDTVIGPNTDTMKALSIMNRTGNSRLMVVEGEHLLGVITLKDMLKFLNLKMDLEVWIWGQLLTLDNNPQRKAVKCQELTPNPPSRRFRGLGETYAAPG